ncbi:MAG: sugar phosphate isomerase/epimerase family protein [Armatimonadota bacterium]
MGDIEEYARIGLVHHLLFPRCVVDADYHLRTLEEFTKREDIETLDCCIPFGKERRESAINAIRNSDKKIVYALHLFPHQKISLCSTDMLEQNLIRLVVKDQIDMAVAVGAVGFVFPSGADAPNARPEAFQAFSSLCRWLCGELKPNGITAMLEPFDRTFDKKFLYGPTEECVELIESLKPEVGNLAIELDMAHVPLMGESFEHAIKTVAPYLKRVHLGNCVMRDSTNPWYGDKHPPIGIEGGEIDVPELEEILRLLLDVGYLSRENRRALVLEIQPFPGKSADETVNDNMNRLKEAWRNVSKAVG